MGLFDRFKQSSPEPEPTPTPPEPADHETPEFASLMARFCEATALPALELHAEPGDSSPYASKLRGRPYLPPGFAYPLSKNPRSAGTPLLPLCQLNFAQLPPLPGFPDRGILQFYCEADDLYGADFDRPTDQVGFRVVYHEDIVHDESKLLHPPELPDGGDVYFPIDHSYTLRAETREMPMSTGDFRFDSTFMPLLRDVLDSSAEQYWHLPDKTIDAIDEHLSSTGHHMGGYPYFTQEDPRSYQGALQMHTVLLLQIDSIDDIMWGDCGVCGFFITPEALAARDFSSVIYNWDCC